MTTATVLGTCLIGLAAGCSSHGLSFDEPDCSADTCDSLNLEPGLDAVPIALATCRLQDYAGSVHRDLVCSASDLALKSGLIKLMIQVETSTITSSDKVELEGMSTHYFKLSPDLKWAPGTNVRITVEGTFRDRVIFGSGYSEEYEEKDQPLEFTLSSELVTTPIVDERFSIESGIVRFPVEVTRENRGDLRELRLEFEGTIGGEQTVKFKLGGGTTLLNFLVDQNTPIRLTSVLADGIKRLQSPIVLEAPKVLVVGSEGIRTATVEDSRL